VEDGCGGGRVWSELRSVSERGWWLAIRGVSSTLRMLTCIPSKVTLTERIIREGAPICFMHTLANNVIIRMKLDALKLGSKIDRRSFCSPWFRLLSTIVKDESAEVGWLPPGPPNRIGAAVEKNESARYGSRNRLPPDSTTLCRRVPSARWRYMGPARPFERRSSLEGRRLCHAAQLSTQL
jgi:hypothetical protein